MMRAAVTFAAFLLPLTACGGREGIENNSSGAEQATATEPVPDNATDDPQNSVVPLPAASPTPVAIDAFPRDFQGRWGLVPNDCDPALAYAAKGLMVVEPKRVVFYESRGTASRIEQATPARLVAQFSFTGEGQEWQRRTAMTLLDGGRTLLTETPDDPEPPMRSLRYARCPA